LILYSHQKLIIKTRNMKKNIIQKFIFLVLLSSIISTASAQEAMLGEVRLFSGNFAPRGWAFCHGQLIAISQNQSLFSIIGTYYGGDGRTTFGLPDLRGRVPLGIGQGPGLSNYTIGQKAGSENKKISASEMPAHTHDVLNLSEMNFKSSPADKSGTEVLVAGNPSGSTKVTNIKTNSEGGTASVSIVQPVLGMNYIIALQGIFPSRN
jgi:microcystin-dependent protein